MRSPFLHDVAHYPGGKGLSFRNVVNLMPPHDRYIETHLGGGAVMRNKRPARESFGIDLDERVIERWKHTDPMRCDVIHGCALEVLPSLRPDADTLIYADPPYIPSTRRTARYYRHDYAEDDHVRLLLLLKTLPSMVIISGYESELYDRALAGWHRTAYMAATHRGQVEEVAWTNFVPGPLLHDYRYVGSDFRERETFRRRTNSLAGRLSTAEDLELHGALAILGELRPDALLAAARRLQ